MKNRYRSIRKSGMAALLSVLSVLSYGQETVRLGNGAVTLEWDREDTGYVLGRVEADGVQASVPVYQHRLLWSREKPSTDPMPVYDSDGRETVFPDPQYRYIIATWQQNLTPVLSMVRILSWWKQAEALSFTMRILWLLSPRDGVPTPVSGMTSG